MYLCIYIYIQLAYTHGEKHTVSSDLYGRSGLQLMFARLWRSTGSVAMLFKRFGIEPQRYSGRRGTSAQPLTCGHWAASWPSCVGKRATSLEI